MKTSRITTFHRAWESWTLFKNVKFKKGVFLVGVAKPEAPLC